MAKVEMLRSESEEEKNTDESNLEEIRMKRKLERITKKNTNQLNKPENKIQSDMTDNQLTALELNKVYKTNQEKWLKSYRGFPLNIPMKYLIATLMFFILSKPF